MTIATMPFTYYSQTTYICIIAKVIGVVVTSFRRPVWNAFNQYRLSGKFISCGVCWKEKRTKYESNQRTE